MSKSSEDRTPIKKYTIGSTVHTPRTPSDFLIVYETDERREICRVVCTKNTVIEAMKQAQQIADALNLQHDISTGKSHVVPGDL